MSLDSINSVQFNSNSVLIMQRLKIIRWVCEWKRVSREIYRYNMYFWFRNINRK